jgi:tetratricopeptide (TPR) repeat protein
MWEESRDYNKAIDRYLEITENMFSPDQLDEIYNNCFNIAMNCAKDRIQTVVPILGQRLLKIGRFDSAADIYESVGYYEKAIEAYV